jgi:hypothetical protein
MKRFNKSKFKTIKVNNFEELKKRMAIYKKLGENDTQSLPNEVKPSVNNDKNLRKEA